MKEENDDIAPMLNNMIDSKSIEDIKLAASIIKNQPDMVSKESLKNHWYNINDYINKNTKRYVELYCTNEVSDKVYILVANKNNNWGYEITAYYGRRGKTMQSDKKGQVSEWSNVFDNIIKDKLKKGYNIINEE